MWRPTCWRRRTPCRDVERISEREAAALVTFLHRGGVVLVSATTTGQLYSDGRFSPFWIGIRDDHHRLRAANATSVWPPRPLEAAPTTIEHHEIGLGRLVVCPPDSNHRDTILEHLAIALDKTRGVPVGILPELEAALRQRTRVAARRRNTRTVLHFLNYNVALGRSAAGAVPTLRNVAVNLTLPNNRTGTDHDHPPHTRARRRFRGLNPIPTTRTHTQLPAPHLEHPPDRRHPLAATNRRPLDV